MFAGKDAYNSNAINPLAFFMVEELSAREYLF
jgi:hypothetical protein